MCYVLNMCYIILSLTAASDNVLEILLIYPSIYLGKFMVSLAYGHKQIIYYIVFLISCLSIYLTMSFV